MLKKLGSNFCLSLLLLLLAACSSSDNSGEDLDISEIQEIESTGEFSEDEFFADEKIEDAKEEKLVGEVKDLESEIDVAQEESLDLDNDDLAFDVGSDDEADLLAEVGLGADEQGVANDKAVDIADNDLDEVLGEDLGGDIEVSEEDLGNLEDLGLGEEEVDLGEDLALDDEDSLFRDDTTEKPVAEAPVETEVAAEESLLDIDQTETTDNFVADADSADEPKASSLVQEEVKIDDISYAPKPNLQAAATAVAPKVSAKTYVPVKKMKTTPYTKNGVLVNGIYFVREGDTLRGIADKIYGSGSAVDFTVVNAHLKPGRLKVGQKIYYNSPQRPQDRSRLMTYYEDARLPASNYAAAAGDNIRSLSKNLLGHSRSWMEIWATNLQIQSKGALEAPYQIRYWRSGAVSPAPTLAQQPIQKIAPKAPQQANLNLKTQEPKKTEPKVAAAVVEPSLKEPEPVLDDAGFEDDIEKDMAAAEVDAQDDFENDVFEDDLAEDVELAEIDDEPIMEDMEAPKAVAKGKAFNAEAPKNPRQIAKSQQGFPVQNGGLMEDTTRLGVIGLALLLLLAVAYLVVKRRRASQEVVEMESFDFGGDTVIEEEQSKTQVDI